MEPNESGLSSYFRHQQSPPHHHQQTPNTAPGGATTTASPTNGILPNNSERGPQMVSYPHSAPSAVSSPLETVMRRKRGRPRKYGSLEQAATAKRLSSSSPISQTSKKKDQRLGEGGGGASSYSAYSSKKSQLTALGNAGQSFTPYIITVAAGEDVGQKIMLFMQQSKREICILSASGTISNASLRQPATSGGNITYEGRFNILSLSGSYVCTELGGRTGGLSVCLSSTDGQIIGGGVGGPLTAAGPVQVIVGTFLVDFKKGVAAGVKGDISASKLPPPVSGGSVPSTGFQSAVDSSARTSVIRSSSDHQNIGLGQFLIQPRGMQVTSAQPSDWMGAIDARDNANYDLTGRTGFSVHHSPENGDYEQIAD